MGAIITTVVSAVRSRKQPIGYRTEVVPVFKGRMFPSSVVGSLSLQSSTGGYAEQVPNLFIAKIEVVNRGNKDYASFRLGFTLFTGDAALISAASSADRHHQAEVLTTLGPAAPVGELDYVLRPFNRKDLYAFTLYVVAQQGQEQVGEIRLSSPEPVIFTKAPTVAEIAAEAAKGMIGIGPLRIGFR